jgi:hypothetical protein
MNVEAFRMLWFERKYLVEKQIDKVLRWIVWRMPRRMVMWAYVRVVAHATTGRHGDQIVPELLAMDALRRWDDESEDRSGVSHE